MEAIPEEKDATAKCQTIHPSNVASPTSIVGRTRGGVNIYPLSVLVRPPDIKLNLLWQAEWEDQAHFGNDSV